MFLLPNRSGSRVVRSLLTALLAAAAASSVSAAEVRSYYVGTPTVDLDNPAFPGWHPQKSAENNYRYLIETVGPAGDFHVRNAFAVLDFGAERDVGRFLLLGRVRVDNANYAPSSLRWTEEPAEDGSGNPIPVLQTACCGSFRNVEPIELKPRVPADYKLDDLENDENVRMLRADKNDSSGAEALIKQKQQELWEAEMVADKRSLPFVRRVYMMQRAIGGPALGDEKPGSRVVAWKSASLQSALLGRLVTDDQTEALGLRDANDEDLLWKTLDAGGSAYPFVQSVDTLQASDNMFRHNYISALSEWRVKEGSNELSFVKGSWDTSAVSVSLSPGKAFDEADAAHRAGFANVHDLQMALTSYDDSFPTAVLEIVPLLLQEDDSSPSALLTSDEGATPGLLRMVASRADLLKVKRERGETTGDEKQALGPLAQLLEFDGAKKWVVDVSAANAEAAQTANTVAVYWQLYSSRSLWVASEKQHGAMWATFAVVIVIALFFAIKERPDCAKEEEVVDGGEDVVDVEDKEGSPPPESKRDAGFRRFQILYLAGWYFCFFSDWLNGTVMFDLVVSNYGWSAADGSRRNYFNEFMVFGFATAVIFGVVIGSIADAVGRKTACLCYCVLNGMMAVSFFFNNYATLAFGQFANGIATRLLFSVFEAWYVQEHLKRGYSGDKLGSSLGWMYFGGSLTAILAGLVSQLVEFIAGDQVSGTPAPAGDADKWTHFSVSWGGRLYVYVLMMCSLATGFCIILFSWREHTQQTTNNTSKPQHGGALEDSSAEVEITEEAVRRASLYSRGSAASLKSDHSSKNKNLNQEKKLTLCGSIGAACGCIAKDPRILLLGLSVALFEASMYLFVVNWVPSMYTVAGYANLPEGTNKISCPTIFSVLLSGYLIGSCLCNSFLSRGFTGRSVAVGIYFLGCVGLALPASILYLMPKNFKRPSTVLYLPGSPEYDDTTTVMALQVATYTGLILFEVAIGMYMPTMGGLKASLVPEEIRATLYNIFYIPSNLLICIVLLSHLFLEKTLDTYQVQYIGVGALGIGFVLLLCLSTCFKWEDASGGSSCGEGGCVEGASDEDDSDLDDMEVMVRKKLLDNEVARGTTGEREADETIKGQKPVKGTVVGVIDDEKK
eukprot:g1292.t1